MIKDRLPELKQPKKRSSASPLPNSPLISNKENVNFAADAEEREHLHEQHVEIASDVVGDDDDAEEEEAECSEVPHNPVLNALLKVYSEILLEFDLIKRNLELMKEMILAKNARKFNEKEFYKIRHRTVQVANNVMGKFQTIEINLPKENDFRTLARMKRILYYGIFQRYVEIWTETERFLQEYESTMKMKLRAQSRILQIDLTEEEIDTLVSNKETNLYACNILEDTENARKTVKALMDRLGELQKLEKSIGEVHTLFIRLQRMVVEQGAVMQSIEKHYNDAQNYVEDAAGDIGQVRGLIKSNLKKRIILVVISIILILIIILLIICI